MRWLVIIGFFVLAIVAWHGGAIQHIGPCVVAALAAAFGNTINHWSVHRLRWVYPVTWAAIVADVLLITALVTVTGGVLSPFVMMYVVQVVATAMLVGFVAAMGSALLSALSCVLSLWLLPADRVATLLSFAPPTLASLSYQIVRVGFLLYCLTLLAFLGGYISNRLQRSERDAARSHARTVRALASLRVAHADLAATYARLRATEAQLVHDEKMRALGLFVAGIAHELNNPIAVVAGNIDHLDERLGPLQPLLTEHAAATQRALPLDDRTGRRAAQRLATFIDELPQLLRDCRDGMRRASEIVRSLHSFSRNGSSDAFQTADLHAMLDRTLNLVRHRAAPSVTIERAYGDIPPVECLPSQLDQVFLNLLLNAVDAVGQCGTIVVATSCLNDTGGGRVTVRVRDSGAGISADVLAHIFDPFFTTKPVGKGAGLGLSVSYGIVARHGGTIDVSAPPGEGATFTVVLPVTQRDAMRTDHASASHD